MNKVLQIGFSPCPNDCFIFDALLHHKIDTEGLDFEPVIEDVESLNKRAFSSLDANKNESLPITKLSYFSYANLTSTYILLDAGSALGNNCGPLLISKKKYSIADVPSLSIAIPGKLTTANFLLSLAFPAATKKTQLVFSEIENAVLADSFDAGLIIHENRFTYEAKGLQKIIDLGSYWEELTQLPIPLGGIVMQRNQPQELIQKVNRLIRKSVEFAFNNPTSSADFVQAHAQEMSVEVQNKHINLYVNEYSIDLGKKGHEAVQMLFNKAIELGIIDKVQEPIFIS